MKKEFLKNRLEQIVTELEAMYQRDQEMRNQPNIEDEGVWDFSVDEENTKKLKAIIDEIGWPAISLVGAQASHQAWLLAQHADHDPEFQAYCLSLMRRQPEGEVNKSNIAYLEDRIRTGRGEPQLYGTQFRRGESGNLEPFPIENVENLDKRRAEMGSFAVHAKWMSEIHDA